MALETEPNPNLLPKSAFRIRFHSVGGYGTDRHRQAADRHPRRRARPALQGGAEIRLGEERRADQLLHHAQPRAGADHQRRARGRRDRRLARPQGVQPLQSAARAWSRAAPSSCSRTSTPVEVWKELPEQARKTIRDKKIKFFVIDAFAVAKQHAPTPELETRMMGIAFIGAVCGHVDRIVGRRLARGDAGQDPPADLPRSSAPRAARSSKATWRSSAKAWRRRKQVDYNAARIRRGRARACRQDATRTVAHFGRRCAGATSRAASSGFLDARIFRRHRGRAVPRRHHRRGAGLAGHRPVHAGRQRRLQGQGPVPPRRAGVHRRPLHRLHGMRAGLPGRGDPEHGARHPRAAARRPSASSTSPRAQREALRASGPCAQRGGARDLSRREGRRRRSIEIVPQAAETLDIDNAVTAAQSRQAGRGAGDLPGRQDAAVLRRDGEGHARQRRPLLGRDRSVEMHRLPRMHRGVRTARAGRAPAGRGAARHAADAVRVPQPHAQHAGALRRRRDQRPTATPSG